MKSSKKKSQKDVLVLIDGNALVHRGFHALPPLTTRDGTMVNAVFGFTSILLNVLQRIKPTYVAVTFDKKKKTFRHKKYKQYKATRIKAPQELYDQIPIVKKVVHAFNIPSFEKDGYEADDLIGTLAVKNKHIDTLIVTGDLDVLQLVNEHVRVFTLKKGINDTVIYDIQGVKDRYDLKPSQIIDYKALRGDPSDNIPGVKGVGEKTAIILIKEFKTLENLYLFLDRTQKLDKETFMTKLNKKNIGPAAMKVLRGQFREKLIQEKDMAFLSKEIATIVTNVPLSFDLKKCVTKDFDRNELVQLFQRLEFRSLLARLPKSNAEESASRAALRFSESTISNTSPEPSQHVQGILFRQKSQTRKDTPLPNDRSSKSLISQKTTYTVVDTKQKLHSLIQTLKKVKQFAVDTETSRLDIVKPVLVGISISHAPYTASYIPVHHDSGAQISAHDIKKALTPILEHARIKKIGHNLKYDYSVFKTFGIELAGMSFDTMIGAYILNPSGRNLSLSDLAFAELGYEMQPITDLIGAGTPKKSQDQISFSKVPIDKAAFYACEDADITLRVYDQIKPRVHDLNLQKLLHDIEMPLIPVLVSMEQNGVKINSAFLGHLSTLFTKEIGKLEKEIYKHAGTRFNINSTQQLSGILFEKLKLPTKGLKKTQTSFSTAAGELDKLKGKHEIIDHILKYREYEKLRNTYVDALPELIRKDTGRIHTSFNQTITATGRLSSTNPNLQNIPIRTEIGREIRKAFIAEEGYQLLSLDYSQIELRVVAHVAKDKKMLDAFHADEDIHRATAATIFNIPPYKVDYDKRRFAKIVNFGMIYGMSPFGLSQSLGVDHEKAEEIIDAYFNRYSGVRQYMIDIEKQGYKKGYVQTLLGRKRFIPELKSKNWQLRQAGRRMAINMPIQGTQADIIKMAMITIFKKINTMPETARMILQVHDELVFEVKKDKVEKIARMCKREMEHAYKLLIPLKVDVYSGQNWGEMKEIHL